MGINIHFKAILAWLNIKFLCHWPKKISRFCPILKKNANHGSDLFPNCQPEYMNCFEKASEIDSESRLEDKLVCMSFLILILVFKRLESG